MDFYWTDDVIPTIHETMAFHEHMVQKLYGQTKQPIEDFFMQDITVRHKFGRINMGNTKNNLRLENLSPEAPQII